MSVRMVFRTRGKAPSLVLASAALFFSLSVHATNGFVQERGREAASAAKSCGTGEAVQSALSLQTLDPKLTQGLQLHEGLQVIQLSEVSGPCIDGLLSYSPRRLNFKAGVSLLLDDRDINAVKPIEFGESQNDIDGSAASIAFNGSKGTFIDGVLTNFIKDQSGSRYDYLAVVRRGSVFSVVSFSKLADGSVTLPKELVTSTYPLVNISYVGPIDSMDLPEGTIYLSQRRGDKVSLVKLKMPLR